MTPTTLPIPIRMKHITLFACAALFGATMQAQVFTSGFEDWTDDLPDDWMGSKTQFTAADVAQVSENPHGGSYAVRLTNTSNTHKRFTTQNVTVTEGTVYNFSFWVRGSGEIRTGFFDGLSDAGSSYAYQAYVTATDTWTQVTQQVTAPPGSTSAQFILSVRNSAAPEHIVVDDVEITEATVDPPTEATIAEIQGTGDESPFAGEVVTTSGVVSAVNGTVGYFLQDGTGPWSGIYVFTNPGDLVRGDAVTITGGVVEFNGQTQISNVTGTTVTSSGNELTPTTITTAEGNTEPYESVLVRVVNANCVSAGSFGQYTVNDGSGPVLVDDVLYAHPFVVGTNYDITGVLQYAFSEWRILPRDVNDVSVSTGFGEFAGASVAVFPNPANDALTIELGTLNGRTEFTLTDAAGRVVHGDVLTAVRGTVDLNGLANGLYVLTLRNGSDMWSTRVQIQH
jgi:DNA/RNA endonuclease YhcR with UshA esterase domain